jgi:hypothetical protein
MGSPTPPVPAKSPAKAPAKANTKARSLRGVPGSPSPARTRRTPWSNRFDTPLPEALIADLPTAAAPAARHARAVMQSLQLCERLEWRGVLHWTIVCHTPQSPAPLAFLVLDPSRPVLCIPLPDAALAALPRVPKSVREVLAQAPLVAGIRWATWELTSKTVVDDLARLLAAHLASLPQIPPTQHPAHTTLPHNPLPKPPRKASRAAIAMR